MTLSPFSNITKHPKCIISPNHTSSTPNSVKRTQKTERAPALTQIPDQNTFFYNNHPIRFVSLVGLIVARTDVYRRTLLTLDDSSGATVEVAVLQKSDQADPKTDLKAEAKKAPADQDQDYGKTNIFTGELTADQTPWSAFSITAPTLTGFKKTIHITFTDHHEIDISSLQPGTLVRVKGILSTFRNNMQIHLERFERVADTNVEMRFLDDRLRFLIEVLSVPWVLSDEEIEVLQESAERGDEQAIEEQRRAQKRARKRLEREDKDARAIARQYEREEKTREEELNALRQDGERVMKRFGF